eukprot:scaffold794_cov131-Cylindrotheca_fusiformis.AAC.6
MASPPRLNQTVPCPSPSRTSHLTETSALDIPKLRNALRLLHSIQKERGSSMYYYADNETFEKVMIKNRSSSDVAARYIKQDGLNILSNLNKIRNLIDAEKDSKDELVFHRIFVCFNVLASAIVHDCIIPQVPGEYHKSIIRKRHKRTSLSMDMNDKLTTNISFTPENSMRRTGSSANLNGSPSPASVASDPSIQLLLYADHDVNIQALLNLLNIFVQLKESAGIERAVLSTALVFREQQSHSIRMMLNDLVLQVENQRSLVSQLEELPPSHHRNLVLELAQLSPRLKELQSVILSDFEALQHEEYGSEGIWDLLTEYIDKLHSVELLIVEDLEISLPYSSSSNADADSTYSTLLLSDNRRQPSPELSPSQNHLMQLLLPALSESTMRSETIAQVEAMSAEEVKIAILAALNAPRTLNAPVKDSPTTTLNEDLQEVLQQNPLPKTRSREWDISIYEIKFNKRIGQGASATTYLADWSGQKVAVKVASITKFGLDGWRREVAALQRLHHPNVIRLMGSVEHQDPLTYCLVLEYCNSGDLNTALKYPTPCNFFFHVSISIANAMSYLHKRHIIHRDLKPHNVLCHGNIASGNFTVKVTDFGVAAENVGLASDGGSSSEPADTSPTPNLTGETGTYRWMAPEVIRHEPYSSLADVYSFAIIMWQLLTHDEPFTDVDSLEAAMLVATSKIRPPMPDNTPESIVKLINSNWSDNPRERWEFEEIETTLEKIKAKATAKEKDWLDATSGHPVYVYKLPQLDAGISHPRNLNPEDKGKRRASGLLGNFFGVQKKFGARGKGW